MELSKDVLSADIRSGCVQAGFRCIPHLERVSHSLDNTPYFGEQESLNIDAASASLAFQSS